MLLQAGTQLGPYTIVAPLGAGGMGEVYVARDPRLDRKVAIKVLPERLASDSSALSRFEREAKAVAALSHPNILSIHDFGTEHGVSYAVMEYLEGETLKARIHHSPMPLDAVLKTASEIVDGLAAAHSKGVIHRDLKPENIFVTAEGRIKLLDFGLARYRPVISQSELTSQPTRSRITEEGMVMGTAPYMSPEQLRGETVDERSDIFSFGCVLYEMITGKRAFQGNTSADIISAILNHEPPEPSNELVRVPQLNSIVRRCLKKKPDQRYASAVELASALNSVRQEQSQSGSLTRQISQQIRRPVVGIPVTLLVLLAVAGVVWLAAKNAKVRWARDEAIPEIIRLVDAERYDAAYHLALKAEPVIPNDPVLKKLWPQVSRTVTIQTDPEGATVYRKEYRSLSGEWELVGRSPLVEVRIPIGLFRWKIEKAGFHTLERSDRFPQFKNPGDVATLNFPLDPEGSVPDGMVRVPGKEKFSLQIPGLDHLPPVDLQAYFMDRHEVTNKEFLAFVKAGGYQNRSYWKHRFLKDDREFTFEDAIPEFRDSTGRPGPATWEVGSYPAGQEDLPVTGVSWYEAAAYAEFAGKSLPTVYHWNLAAGTWDSPDIIPISNFGDHGLKSVMSSQGLHRYGTYDMAGNAKEWCSNESEGKRFILGGAWNEPTYMFNDPDAQSPFARQPTYGFRCVKYSGAAESAATGAITWATRDYRVEKPVPDEIFQAYRSIYSYDRSPLNPAVEKVDDSGQDWKWEKVSFDAAYGNERVVAYLFLPKDTPPPYQAVIFFPGSGVLYLRSSEEVMKDARNKSRIDFVVQSGRAVLYPIYKGTFERNDGLNSDYPAPTSTYRDHVIQWHKDLARSIDYLETRKDIDADRLAFLGSSWGGAMGLLLPALEPRLKANVLIVGGFYLQNTLPEVDQINFVSRVTIPTLMLNGKHDFYLPIATSQIPAFQLLGTAEKDKRQVLYNTGHDIPRKEMIREVLDWLDRYLGPVRR